MSTEELYARYDSQLCAVAPDTGMSWHSAVFFPYNQSIVTPEEEQKLEDNLAVLIKHTDYRLVLRGFTDSVASQRFNLPLSEKRAEFVADWFLSRGILAERVDRTGLGKAQLLVSPEPGVDEQTNRRVELLLVDSDGQPVSLTTADDVSVNDEPVTVSDGVKPDRIS